MPEAIINFTGVNYLAVIVSTAFAFILGMVWWSPALFAKPFIKAIKKSGKSLEDMKKNTNMSVSMGLSALGWLIAAYVLALIVDFFGAKTALQGVQLGALMWLGFTVSLSVNSVAFEGRPKELYFISNGYFLVGLCAMGAILSLWQ